MTNCSIINLAPITQEKYNKLLSEGKIESDVLYEIVGSRISEEKVWDKVLEELKEIKQIIKEIRK